MPGAGPVDVLVAGSGSLARAVCYSLARGPVPGASGPAEVAVVGRSAGAVGEVCQVAGTQAAVSGGGVRFRPVVADLAHGGAAADVLAATSPRVVVVCASLQSPWERDGRPSAWTDLVRDAGFGVTLPLQAAIALRLGRALAEGAAPGAVLVNGCYPDAVNPLLAAAGVEVACGIGNGSTVAASLQAALGLPDQGRLRVLAHHLHLHRPADPADEAVAWCDGEPVGGVGDLLAGQRSVDRRELNQVAGHAGAAVVVALAAGGELSTSVPGPRGLPGGYPVRVAGGAVALDLPPGVTEDDAVARNQRWAELDGVRVDRDGTVALSATGRAALAPYRTPFADGFAAGDVEAVCEEVVALRSRLRASPPGAAA